MPIIPTSLGYDPRLQLLHEWDAVEALVRACVTEHRGVVNVAGDGVVSLAQAVISGILSVTARARKVFPPVM